MTGTSITDASDYIRALADGVMRRYQAGRISQLAAASELAALGLTADEVRERTSVSTSDKSRSARAINHLVVAADHLAATLEQIHACPNRTNRQAVGSAEDRLIHAAQAYRQARTPLDEARDAFLRQYPTADDLVKAFEARQAHAEPIAPPCAWCGEAHLSAACPGLAPTAGPTPTA